MIIEIKKTFKRVCKSIKEMCLNCLPDRVYVKRQFLNSLGYPLNLNCPQTFNEKVNYIKLYIRNPEWIKLIDKYDVKKVITERIGEKYVIPNYGVWNNFEDVNFDILPEQFVLKCTHDSGGGYNM